MSTFTKNEIIELKRDLTVGDASYSAGQKFVVTKVTPTKTHVTLLDNKGELVAEKGLIGTHKSIAGVMSKTNTAFLVKKADHSALKKGNFYTFKQDFKEDEIFFPAGTRVVLVKGGAKPVFETFYRQQNPKASYLSGLGVSPSFFEKFMTPAEAEICELTKDWCIKGLKERTGEETRNFECNVYYKNKKVGEASNGGYGACHSIHVHTPEWEKLIDQAFEIIKPLDNRKEDHMKIKRHDLDEIIIDFFLENHGGLSNLKDYLTRYAVSWLNFVEKHSKKCA